MTVALSVLKRITASIALASALLVLSYSQSPAMPEYSAKTNQGCLACHTTNTGGGLNQTGLEYAASGYEWPPKGGMRLIGPLRKPVRFIIGFLHITASFLWFGTILYVHILLRPAYASKGLPRGEVMLGAISMAVVGITGALLTVSRIRGIEVLYETRWGAMLSVKIAIYIIMISTAAFVVAYLGPRLKALRAAKKAEHPRDGVFGIETLSMFDGHDGRPAYIAFKGLVYDVTNLRLWKNGVHMKHASGADLSDALLKAPHGDEKLDGLKHIGTFDPESKPPLTAIQKAFYFIAYLNLGLVFAVLFVIALWRWW